MPLNLKHEPSGTHLQPPSAAAPKLTSGIVEAEARELDAQHLRRLHQLGGVLELVLHRRVRGWVDLVLVVHFSDLI